MQWSFRAPSFFGTRLQGKLSTRGDTARSFGHKIARADNRTDGVFAEWSWNGETLTVQNDRYGFFPLFYYAKGSEIGVSPSISTLIAEGADAELNDESVALFLRLGQFIGNDTPFRHIHCLPPNATLVWNGSNPHVTGDYEHVPENRPGSRPEAVHRYIELFASAISKRLPTSPRFAVPLTGGRDSRHILLELCRTGFKPHVCATVAWHPEDAAVAALVADQLGLRHAVIEPSDNFFAAEIRKNDLSSFGFARGTWPLALADFLSTEQIDTVYDGIAGDVLSASQNLTPERDRLFRRGHLPSIIEHLLPDTEAALRTLLTPARYRRWSRELAETRLGEELTKHLHAHNPVVSFFFWNRTRRRIALIPYALLSGPFTVFAPYLDHDLFDFLASLPADFVMDRSFHTDAMLSGYPASQVRFENKKEPDPKFEKQYAEFAHRLGMKIGFWRRSDWLRTYSLGARLFKSRLSYKFAGSSAWYLRPAVWLLQLESLVRSSKRCATTPFS